MKRCLFFNSAKTIKRKKKCPKDKNIYIYIYIYYVLEVKNYISRVHKDWAYF